VGLLWAWTQLLSAHTLAGSSLRWQQHPANNGKLVAQSYVAFMLHGGAGSGWKPLELKENKLQHARHEPAES
jgi:hypothetical protein